MWNYSRAFKSIIKKHQIEKSTKALLDLIAAGWDKRDAYMVLGMYNPLYSDEFNQESLDRIISGTKEVNYLKEIKERLLAAYVAEAKLREPEPEPEPEPGPEPEPEPEPDKMYRDKDEVIDELAKTVKDLKGKDKADVLMKIADLQQMKKEKNETEEKTVHFYLPLKCDYCPLFIKEKKSKGIATADN